MGRARQGLLLLLLLLGECGGTSHALLSTIHEEVDHVYVASGVITNFLITDTTVSVHVSKYFGTEALRSVFSDHPAPQSKC